MGNRAVITTREGWKNPENHLGVYLHWNGGKDSVNAFLTYCKMCGFRKPEDDNYGWAYLCKVIGNFFDTKGDMGYSLGVDIVTRLDTDNYDNGVYIIENWDIVDREYHNGEEQSNYPLYDMLMEIDAKQPLEVQFGEEKIKEYLEKQQKEN